MNQDLKSRNPWLRSPIWDGFWMLSGIWLLIPIALLTSNPATLNYVLIIATLLLWLSHRFATTYTAFFTPAYRNLVRKQYKRFFILPTLIFLIVFSFVFAPARMVPLSGFARFAILGTIFFLYNTYHFGIQHYGVLTIYRIRAGQKTKAKLKSYEKIFALVVGSFLVALGQIYHGALVVEETFLYQILSQGALGSSLNVVQIAAPTLIVIMAIVYIFVELQEEVTSFPKILYVVGMAFQGIMAFYLNPLTFLLLWGAQHWLVSIALAGHMAENDKSKVPSSSNWYKIWGPFNRNFWSTVALLAFASILLTPLFQYSARPDFISAGPLLESIINFVLRNQTITRFFIAMSFATVFLHFVMDRAVFRFSDPSIRKVTAPLLFGK